MKFFTIRQFCYESFNYDLIIVLRTLKIYYQEFDFN